MRVHFQGNEKPSMQIQRRLQKKRLLLILDNFEYMMGGVDFVLELLQASPHISMMVTSRQRLDVQAEFALQLVGLPVPELSATQQTSTEDDLEAWQQYSSLRLFEERAKRVAFRLFLCA